MMERHTKTETSPREQTELSAEVLFDVLSSSYRRYVLSYLADATSPTEIGDLAYHVAAWDADSSITEIPDDDADEAEILLYHVHLPKLAAAGLVTYDTESGTVFPGESMDSVTDRISIVE